MKTFKEFVDEKGNNIKIAKEAVVLKKGGTLKFNRLIQQEVEDAVEKAHETAAEKIVNILKNKTVTFAHASTSVPVTGTIMQVKIWQDNYDDASTMDVVVTMDNGDEYREVKEVEVLE